MSQSDCTFFRLTAQNLGSLDAPRTLVHHMRIYSVLRTNWLLNDQTGTIAISKADVPVNIGPLTPGFDSVGERRVAFTMQLLVMEVGLAIGSSLLQGYLVTNTAGPRAANILSNWHPATNPPLFYPTTCSGNKSVCRYCA